MDIGRHIRRQLQLILGPVIGLSLSCYFGYHLVEGDRGLIAWVGLSQQIRETRLEAAQIHGERAVVEQRVALLQNNHLDPDLLDEQAREALNLVAPGEVVILNDDQVK